jgi:hypothetical protein
MSRIRTVVAVGSMALLGVVATGSSALASSGAASGTHPGTQFDPAKAARCFAAHGAKVQKVGDGAYKVTIPASKVRSATKACQKYLPTPPGDAKDLPLPTGKGTVTLQFGAKEASRADKAKFDKLRQCLEDHGIDAPDTGGQVVLKKVQQNGTTTAGTPVGPGDVVIDGKTTKAAGVAIPEDCASLVPEPPKLESSDD